MASRPQSVLNSIVSVSCLFTATVPPKPVPAPVSVPTAPVPSVTFPTTIPNALPTIAPTSFCNAFDFGNPEKGVEGCMPNVLEEARSNPDLSLAVILFERAELTDIFTCPGSFTVLFPTNSAIEMVDAALIEFLLQPENIRELQNLMLYHVLPGFYPSTGLTNGMLIETLFPRRDVEVTVTADSIMFNDATVVTPDTEACNGLIQTISQVLTFLPPRKLKCINRMRSTFHMNLLHCSHRLTILISRPLCNANTEAHSDAGIANLFTKCRRDCGPFHKCASYTTQSEADTNTRVTNSSAYDSSTFVNCTSCESD